MKRLSFNTKRWFVVLGLVLLFVLHCVLGAWMVERMTVLFPNGLHALYWCVYGCLSAVLFLFVGAMVWGAVSAYRKGEKGNKVMDADRKLIWLCRLLFYPLLSLTITLMICGAMDVAVITGSVCFFSLILLEVMKHPADLSKPIAKVESTDAFIFDD